MKINKAHLIGTLALALMASGPIRTPATTLSLFQTVTNTDFTSAGVGGLRDVLTGGTINLTGVSGTVTKAYLYWHGHGVGNPPPFDPTVAGSVLFNGNPVFGHAIGVSASDGWNFPDFNLTYGQAFRADVTSLVRGNGAFTLNTFLPLGTQSQGASLLVFFDDNNPNNNRDILIYDGDDCNDSSTYDSDGWELFMTGINLTPGDAVTLQLHVSDGQVRYQDDALTLNNQTLAPAGQNFAGLSPFNATLFNNNFYQGSLWDINTYDITSFLFSGPNSIVLTTGVVDDFISLIVAVANFKTGSPLAPPPPPGNHAPTIAIQGDAITVDCVPQTGTTQTISALFSDVDGDALSIHWSVNDIPVQTDPIPAGGPPTSGRVSLTYLFPPGENIVKASVSDFYAIPVTSETTVTANISDFTPPTVNCGPSVQSLVGPSGTAPAPSVTGQVTASDNCTPTQFLRISQIPPAGTPLPPGTNFIDITVTDSSGNDTICAVTFVVNTLPPPSIGGLGGGVFALPDSGTTFRNIPVTVGNVLANDSTQPPGGTLSVITYDGLSKQGGTVAYLSEGMFAYTPAFSFVGSDTFTYTITDGTGANAVGTVTIAVLPANHPPLAQPDNGVTLQSTPVNINVLANDSDPDKDTLTVTAVTTPPHGTATFITTGTVTYTPAANFVGVDTFTYTISDGYGGTATATVSVTVNSSNRPPLAANDTATISQGSPVTMNVLANDSDPDGNSLTITAFTQPASVSGSVALNSGGTFTYTPASAFFGVAVFSYTISDGNGGTAVGTVTVNVVPPPPLAVNDTAGTFVNTPVSISVLSNDSDPNKLPLSIDALTNPAHGSIQPSGNSITYTPNGGFVGTDSFTYRISNGVGGVSTATVTITVVAPPPPLCSAVTSSITSGFNGTSISPNNYLWFTANFNASGIPSSGATILCSNAKVIISSAQGNFTYAVPDGRVIFTSSVLGATTVFDGSTWITQVPLAGSDEIFMSGLGVKVPVDLKAATVQWTGDFSADVKGVSINWKWSAAVYTSNMTQTHYNEIGVKPTHAGALLYNNSDHAGTPENVKTADVGGARGGGAGDCTGSWSGTASLNLCGGLPPVAVNDTAATGINTPVTISVLTNDSDPAGSPLTVTAVIQPSHGTTTIASGAVVTYTPAANFTGTDTFTYTISDGQGGTATGTVTVIVKGGAFVTYTQGGWGTTPTGGNPGKLLADNFAQVFPQGVTIGGNFTLRFTAASAVQGFLPQGGTASVLKQSAINPATKLTVFAGQVLALQLSAQFSAAGVTRPGLSALKIVSGKLAGKTVAAVLTMANQVLGGNVAALPSLVSISDLNNVVTLINQNYDNGTTDTHYLAP